MERTIAEELAMNDGAVNPNEASEAVEAESVEKGNGCLNLDFGFLNTPTGPGSIDEYMDHPLNFNESKGMAQVLRGLTGFVDDMALAIIDIVIGSFRIFREKKANV